MSEYKAKAGDISLWPNSAKSKVGNGQVTVKGDKAIPIVIFTSKKALKAMPKDLRKLHKQYWKAVSEWRFERRDDGEKDYPLFWGKKDRPLEKD